MKRRKFLMGAVGAITSLPAAARIPTQIGIGEYQSDFTIITKDDPFADYYSDAFKADLLRIPEKRLVCRSARAVAEQVKLLHQNGDDFAIRSTGHCFAGFSQHEKLVIDTSYLSSFRWIKERGTFEVGAATWLLPMYRKLAETSHVLPGGTYFSVGTGGATLGGGIGYLSRQFGLLSDHVYSFNMVTAEGEIVTASRNENPDLFWALRGGGGGSLGVITSLEFIPIKLEQSTSINWVGTYHFKDAAKLVHAWQRWTEAAGNNITTHVRLQRYRQNDVLIHIKGWSLVDRLTTKDFLQQLLGPKQTILDANVRSGPPRVVLDHLIDWHNFLTPENVHVDSDFAGRFYTEEEMDEAIISLMREPIASLSVYLEALGGKIKDGTINDGCYPHRDAEYLIYYISPIPTPDRSDERLQNLQNVKAGFSSAVTGNIYVNYPNPNLENWQHRYWGENFGRLKETKKQWDPGNFFNHPQSIPL